MDTNAGSLVAQILVNTNPLEVGLRSAGAMIASFASSMATQLKATASNAFNDTNAAAGLQTTAKALGDLKDAASAFGATGDTVQSALSKMQSSIGKAINGSEVLQSAFEGLGLDIAALARSDSTNAFGVIAQELSKLETQAQRTQLAKTIFGNVDPAFMKFMKELSVDADAVLTRMDKFKVSLSNIDVEQLAKVKTNFENIDNVVKGFYENLSARFAPVLNEIMDSFLNGGDAGTYAAKMADNAFIVLKDTMKGIVSVGASILSVFGHLANGILNISKAMLTLKQSYNDVVDLEKLSQLNEARQFYDPKNADKHKNTLFVGTDGTIEYGSKGGDGEKFTNANRAYLKLRAEMEYKSTYGYAAPNSAEAGIDDDKKRIDQAIEMAKKFASDMDKRAVSLPSTIEDFVYNAQANQKAMAGWKVAEKNAAIDKATEADINILTKDDKKAKFKELGFAQSLSEFGGGAAGQDAAMRAMQSSKQQVQVVSDPALKETNETLKVIAKNTEGDGGEVGE